MTCGISLCLMEIPTAFRSQTLLLRPRTGKIAVPGYQRPIRMVVCIFTIQGGCVSVIETCIPQSRLIRSLKKLFTDTDMHERELKEEMEEFYSYLQKVVLVDGLTIPSENYDLVLDLMPQENNEIHWSYYYACHDTRCLFWLEKYDTTYVTYEVHGVESPAHLSASRVSVICTFFFTDPVNRASPGGVLLVNGISFTALVLCR